MDFPARVQSLSKGLASSFVPMTVRRILCAIADHDITGDKRITRRNSYRYAAVLCSWQSKSILSCLHVP